MKVSFISILCLTFFCVFGQKDVLKFNDLGKWPSVGNPIVSDDGQYAIYSIFYTTPIRKSDVVVQGINNNIKIEIPNVSNVFFGGNSKLVIFKRDKTDSIFTYMLDSKSISFIGNAKSFEISPDINHRWLAYESTSNPKKLVLCDLMDFKNCKEYFNVTDFHFNNKGNMLLIQIDEPANTVFSLRYVNLYNKDTKTVWTSSARAYNFEFTHNNNFLFISSNNEGGLKKNKIWIYEDNSSQAKVLVSDSTINKTGCIVSDRRPKFDKAGRRVFFTLQTKIELKRSSDAVNLDVWSYSDACIQSRQLTMLGTNVGNYLNDYNTAAISIGTQFVVQIEQENEKLINSINSFESDYVLVEKRLGNSFEYYWNHYDQPSIYLVSLKDGKRKLIKERWSQSSLDFYISPHGKYIVYYDQAQMNYFCYTIADEKTCNVTKSIASPLFDEEYDCPGLKPHVGLAGWLEKDEDLLIYDNYDIWQVDLSQADKAVNITKGYGNQNKIRFRVINKFKKDFSHKGGGLLLQAFDVVNKYNGFFMLTRDTSQSPILLSMGPYVYNWWNISTFEPIKARNSNVWIVRRMNCSEAPNYFITRNFVDFVALSNLQPQKKNNWIKSELIRWQTFDGSFSEGILYKPEDFDSTKKYPIIFHFYEKLTDKLNEFKLPEVSTGPLNIPYFVSNGFLIFLPNISFKTAETGESIHNSVVSAAKYFSRKAWVDSSRMGIQGHSFGAFGVNYLITKTDVFAAAVSACGPSNFVSGYDAISNIGSLQFLYEVGQNRIGRPLWEDPDAYVRNSPVFNVQNVNVPLLMMSNKQDHVVPFAQGLELFLALRRLNKKVWLLQYDNGNHEVFGKDADDYTNRLIQFFSHYLKGASAPEWMTHGIPAKLKGIEAGLDIKVQK